MTPTPAPVPGSAAYITPLDDDGHPVGDPIEISGVQVTMEMDTVAADYLRSMGEAFARMTPVVASLTFVMNKAARQIARLFGLPPRLLGLPEKRRTPAAVRTRSAAWRAGTRRTKRHARRGRMRR